MVMRWRIRLINAGLLAKPTIINCFYSAHNLRCARHTCTA